MRVPGGGGAVRCPLPDHDDPYPSCQVNAEAEQGWWCFGCERGGRVYDLGSLLTGGPWGRDLRGEAFKAARELVAAALTRSARTGYQPPPRASLLAVV